MCSDEHGQGLALVKMGLRLKAAFHGGYAQSSEMWRFWPEGTLGLVPKGLQDSAGGFNPWCQLIKSPAPKGR